MPVRVARPVALAGAVLGVTLLAAGCGSSKKAGSSTTTGTSSGSSTLVALVSDIGKFTDKGFNQNQLAGFNKAKAQLGDRKSTRLNSSHSLLSRMPSSA